MEELGYAQTKPNITYKYNMACIYMSKSAAMYHKAQHIDTRVYHLRDLWKEGTMELEKIDTTKQVADSFTKATPRPLFDAHRLVMMGG